MPRQDMRIRDFLLAVRDAVRPRLDGDLAGFQDRQRFSLLQFYRDDPAVHYEVWVQRRTARLEIGLHFEGQRDFSYAWAAALAERAPELVARTGPEYELEEWTASWTRLHRALPLPPLMPDTVEPVAVRLLELMRATAPVLEEIAPTIAASARAAP